MIRDGSTVETDAGIDIFYNPLRVDVAGDGESDFAQIEADPFDSTSS